VEWSFTRGDAIDAADSVSVHSQIRSRVDVIVPCHNVGHVLQRALDSVFAQTWVNWHVYAVDDGSHDGTLQILKNNQSHCSFVSQTRAGAAAARNRAIRMSSSPFVAFLDADDEWLPTKLERQIAALEKDPSIALVCSRCSVSESGMERYANSALPGIPNSGRLFQYLVRECFVFTPTVVVRRNCLEEIGLFNESLPVSEDFNLWLRIAARRNICFIPDVLAVINKRPGSLSACIDPGKRLQTGVYSLQDVQARCLSLTSTEARSLHGALAQRFYFYGAYLLSVGENRRARPQLLSAIHQRHTHWRAMAKFGLSYLPYRISNLLSHLRKMFLRRVPPGNPSRLATGRAS